MRRFVFLAVSFLGACGGETTADAGRDAGSMDAGRDAGSIDAGRDASASDAGIDAAHDAGADSGIDCSVIGCGAPTVCGEACDAPCGCCACGEGEEITIGGEPYVCAGGCYARRGTGGSGDTCASTADCGEGLSCCYPCGIPDCENVCTPTCAPGTPGCAGGCPLVP